MTDYLPDFVDAETQEENPSINADNIDEQVEDIKESEDAFTEGEGDEEIIQQELEEDLKKEEEEVPVVTARKKLTQDEVFSTPKVKPVTPLTDEPKKKKKRVMSEKQLANLKKAREKAMANKKARKEAKEKGLPKPDLPPTKKEIKKEQIKKEKQEQYELTKLSDEQLEELSFRAVQKYDTIRKERKAKKKEQQSRIAHKEKVKKQILKAQGVPDADDIWSQALGGMLG